MGLFSRFRQGAAKLIQRVFRRPAKPTMKKEEPPKAKPVDWGPKWSTEHEEMLKKKDQAWRINQQKKAYRKFHENYGMSRVEYDTMFDEIGGAMDELSMYMEGGSPTVVEMYKQFTQKYNGDPEEFVELVNRMVELNPGTTQEELVNKIYSALEGFNHYKEKVGNISLSEYMDYVGNIIAENPGMDSRELEDRIIFEIDRGV